LTRKILYLDPVGGVAGDMFLAAAVDLGVAPAAISAALAGLGVPGWRLVVARSERHAIVGTHLDVEVDAALAGGQHRSLSSIQSLIQGAQSMPERARQRAQAVFACLGAAEAKVHGVPLDQVHFHEVGAVDSIVDISGAAVVLELLGDPEVLAAAPPLGSGMVKTEHGMTPVPGPATLEILKDVPVRFEGVGELTTPTGAALLRTLSRIGEAPEMVVERVGYGVGTADFKDRPNVLRAIWGRASHAGPAGTYVVEANVDDCSPQVLGFLIERLLEVGAVDAYVLPATMKKSRPGHLLGAVVPADARDAVTRLLLSESTTLGVRSHRVERDTLERESHEVQTPYGKVQVKVGKRGGAVLNAQPEFEDCRRLAVEHRVPLKQVWTAALVAFGRS